MGAVVVLLKVLLLLLPLGIGVVAIGIFVRNRLRMALAHPSTRAAHKAFDHAFPGRVIVDVRRVETDQRADVVGVYYGRTSPPMQAYFEVEKGSGRTTLIQNDARFRDAAQSRLLQR